MITYEYYPAFMPDGSPKQGVNRIVFLDGQEITREYMPVDPRTEPSPLIKLLTDATPEEIEQIKQLLGLA
jgi:hypothetical protein